MISGDNLIDGLNGNDGYFWISGSEIYEGSLVNKIKAKPTADEALVE